MQVPVGVLLNAVTCFSFLSGSLHLALMFLKWDGRIKSRYVLFQMQVQVLDKVLLK